MAVAGIAAFQSVSNTVQLFESNDTRTDVTNPQEILSRTDDKVNGGAPITTGVFPRHDPTTGTLNYLAVDGHVKFLNPHKIGCNNFPDTQCSSAAPDNLPSNLTLTFRGS